MTCFGAMLYWVSLSTSVYNLAVQKYFSSYNMNVSTFHPVNETVMNVAHNGELIII